MVFEFILHTAYLPALGAFVAAYLLA